MMHKETVEQLSGEVFICLDNLRDVINMLEDMVLFNGSDKEMSKVNVCRLALEAVSDKLEMVCDAFNELEAVE